MEWINSLQKAISYIESRLTQDIAVDDISKEVSFSPFYFQKVFRLTTGYSLGEYIRCRRLYLAAMEALSGGTRVIDLAYRYGYETPKSFTRAFTRFHGVSPLQLRRHPEKIHVFLPLKIRISIQGGNEMDYAVEKEESFQVIGFAREISFDAAYREIPAFWDEFRTAFCGKDRNSKTDADATQKCVWEHAVGEFGICMGCPEEKGSFQYVIAGRYQGGPLPVKDRATASGRSGADTVGILGKEMALYTIPEAEWVKFSCTGPMPEALQSVNTKIFQEWLPNHPEFQLAKDMNIKWYSDMDIDAADYQSAIWIPVIRKQA